MEKEAKKRKGIPLKLEKQIMKEYSSLCAICGKADPQVHHIDEDPSNNDVENLIPLCTDCHLIKIHKKNIYPREIVRLFRIYKSKLILSDKFLPIFNRMTFLLVEDISAYDPKALKSEYDDLISFIKVMKMGSEYSKRIKKLLFFHSEICVSVVSYAPDREYESIVGTKSTNRTTASRHKIGNSVERFKNMYRENNDKVIELIIEQLVYQGWE